MGQDNIEKIYELTPLQQGMLFHNLYSPDSPVYHLQSSFRLDGALDFEALQKSWSMLLARHAVLRTGFVWERIEKPYQVVNRETGATIEYHDFRALDADGREAGLGELIEAQRLKPFSLKKPPLARLALIALDENLHHMVWTFHHIILEGWSVGILMKEFWRLYGEYRMRRQPELAPALPYENYINWLKQQDQSRAEDYWRQQLGDFTQPTQLPIDRASATGMANVVTVSTQSEPLPPRLGEALREMARNYRITANTLFQGMWGLLLSLYSGEDRVVYGTAVSGRPSDLPGAESIVGLFVNTLPVCIDLRVDESVAEWLRRLQVEQARMREFEYSPLMQIKSWSGVPGGQPLFNTMLGYESGADGAPFADSSTGLRFSDFSSHRESDQPLTLFAVSGKNPSLTLMYDIERFAADDIQRMLTHCRCLLEAMSAKPEQPISRLSMLSATERYQQLREWNRSSTDFPRGQTVHALFEQQVLETPGAIALEFGMQHMDYAELNQRSNRLAHYLRRFGVGAEVRVGLYLGRGAETVIAILAILKAGGAYVPLDLDYPPSRIDFMLRDCAAPVLLSLSDLTPQLENFAGDLVCLDRDWPQIEAMSPDNPENTCAAENLAYVIYTSGSTGTPKGVEITHRAIVRLVRNTDYYQAEKTDRIAQASTISFDAATFELWASLLNGACLVGVDKGTLLDSRALATCLRDREIDAMFVTTAVFNQVAREKANAFARLKCLMFGGEAVDCDSVRQVLRNPPRRLLHVYGPTESTTFASWYPVQSVTADATSVPIGRPLANTTLYVLDRQRRLLPAGVPGELYIGGDGLARGYLNRPELTEEKFIANPFAENSGERLYRTGDMVRYQENGAIEFLGRLDDQVKLRGFRIEIGEIEVLLRARHDIDSALVLLREDAPGDKRLVAYLVAAETAAPTISELRGFMRKHLPDYMLPAAFVLLEQWPLNANGKIDRAALPLPTAREESLETEFLAPRDTLEQQLSQVWCDVLKLDCVGIRDNFFDLGGHSLLATRVVSRIRDRFDCEISLAELFGQPTLEELAPLVRARLGSAGAPGDVIPVADRSKFLPLGFAQERLWFLEQLDPGSASYNMPFALKLEGDLDVDALTAALQALCQRHESLRTSIRSQDGKPRLSITENLKFELELLDLAALEPNEREQTLRHRMQQEWRNGFDLAKPPLWRAILIKLGECEQVLLLTMHHIIFDGWSMDIFLQEMSRLYRQHEAGVKATLEPLPLQFADYARWSRDWLQGENLARRLEYWKQSLADYETLNLPTDYPRPPVPSYHGRTEEVDIDGVLLEATRSFTRKQGATLYMTMLTAFNVLLYRYSGQTDIVVGSPVAGRNRRDIEAIIGLFINTLAIRTRLDPESSFIEALARAREASFDAQANQDIPFEKLVEELQPERDASRNPIFQVMFNFVDVSDFGLDLPGIEVSQIDHPVETTKFDLTFYVLEKRDRLRLCIDYSLDLFSAESIQEMLAHFVTLLHSVVANPRLEISALPLLSEAQLKEMARQVNLIRPDVIFEPVTEDRQTATISAVFDETATRHASRLAVVTTADKWTYDELQTQAAVVAARLLREPEADAEQVAILFPQGAPMLAAMLGVLKAGKSFVPLDPINPAARLAAIVADSGAVVVLADDSCLEIAGQLSLNGNGVSNRSPLKVIAYASCQQQAGADLADVDATPRSADATAYLLYTSGSTGEPKAVSQIDRNVLHHSRIYSHSLHLRARDNISLFASYAFDAGIMDIFAALLNGATLYPYDVRSAQLGDVVQWLNRNQIGILHLTPTLFRHLFAQPNPDARVESVRAVVMGGEEVTLDDFRLYQNAFGDHCLFVNGYGPTESTTATQYWMHNRSKLERQVVPIGYPVDDTEILLLDEKGNETDVFGEIAIRSRYLATGYWRRAELTEERFVPAEDDPGLRVYRTGDMGRRRLQGYLEFTGRRDKQVKIRGFRVETGEVESALCGHPQVSKAIVLGIDHRGETQLVGYVVLTSPGAAEPGAIRDFARKLLPDYMLPPLLIEIDEVPMTATGKLARELLPEPDFSYTQEREIVAAGSDTERTLIEIWKAVLEIENLGATSNFFDLGGHSLKATQVVSRIRDEFAVSLPLRLVFSHPTVVEMARCIDTARAAEASGSAASDRITATSSNLEQIDLDQLDDDEVERLLNELSDSTEQGQ